MDAPVRLTQDGESTLQAEMRSALEFYPPEPPRHRPWRTLPAISLACALALAPSARAQEPPTPPAQTLTVPSALPSDVPSALPSSSPTADILMPVLSPTAQPAATAAPGA